MITHIFTVHRVGWKNWAFRVTGLNLNPDCSEGLSLSGQLLNSSEPQFLLSITSATLGSYCDLKGEHATEWAFIDDLSCL